MNSQAVEKRLGLDQDSWKQWPSIKWTQVPQGTGVYVFRTAGGSAILRVKGCSDVVYVGSGKIRDRLKAHSRQDWKRWSGTGWVICLIMRAKGLEVAWREMAEPQARLEEADILQQFLVDHFELPPANRRKPRISAVTGAALALHSLAEEERTRVLEQARHLVD